MLIIPKEKPIFANLNSYYLDILKLFEHFQGELGSGAIHFKSSAAEGVFFFDDNEFLNAVFKDNGEEIGGRKALDRLLKSMVAYNYTVDIYKLDPEKVYYWANIPSAKRIYNNLSTDFTDLEGLIKKMASEKLTGYIDAAMEGGKERGLIFFKNGKIIGGSYPWGQGELSESRESRELLVRRTKEAGGVFHVCTIPPTRGEVEGASSKTDRGPTLGLISRLEQLLVICERVITSNKTAKTGFATLLKRQFLAKAEIYPFLDPFAAEFQYSEGKITFAGLASEKDIASGVIEVVKELAKDLGLLPQLISEIGPWSRENAQELARLGIDF